MGKKGKQRKHKKDDKFFANVESNKQEFDAIIANQTAKSRSKLSKKLRKKLQKQDQRNKKNEHHTDQLKDNAGFHMVTVYAKEDPKMDKNFLVTSIRNYVDQPFCPLGYFKGTESTTFYFDSDKDVADAIQSLSKRLQSPSGELMKIEVAFVKVPDFILNCDQVELLQKIVLEKFDATTGILNIAKFHLDSRLIESNVFAPLSNERILKQVLNLVNTAIPNVAAIDLSDNKLSNSCLKLMEGLDLKALSAINLERNNIHDPRAFRHLKSFPLKEIRIIGNGFNRGISNPSCKYFKVIRKELPFLKMVDNHNLNELGPKLFTLDKGAGSNVTGFANAVTEECLRVFLEQYYSFIDTTEKGSLLQAYTPDSQLELRSTNPLIPSRIFEGSGQIETFLNLWPKSKHEQSNLSFDILSLAATEGIAQVKGICLFEESPNPIQFKRTMKIIPFNSGFCCALDLLEVQ